MPHDTTFFDIHMHAMDLSHPNLLAFINRIQGVGGKLVAAGLAKPFLSEQETRIYNLLSVMENSIEDFYDDLADILDHNPGLIDKVLFGSDFMINLMWTGSYNQYLRAFLQTGKLTDAQKLKLCNANPARFMFSGAVD